MDGEKPIVYLEDVEQPNDASHGSKQGVPPTATNASNSKRTFFTTTSTEVKSVKRQRTLADMLSGSQGQKSTESEPLSKKPKLSIPKLNSIAFSLSAYEESLSEEEKRLLQLECDMMGKSWYGYMKAR